MCLIVPSNVFVFNILYDSFKMFNCVTRPSDTMVFRHRHSNAFMILLKDLLQNTSKDIGTMNGETF